MIQPHLHLCAGGFPIIITEHSGVQRRTSAVAESFSQTQRSLQIPEGESVPDFEEKLRPITAQEGKVNCFLYLFEILETASASSSISLHITS